MKTLFNSVKNSSLVAIILLASLFSINASAATVSADLGASHTDIKKVVVTGNTNVLIIQNANESVKVDELDLDKVSLTQVGGTLTINSSENNPITVIVYVKDIYRIDASDKANVKTAGKFTVKNLQVILKDEAKARVKATTESLYTVIDGHAKLELIGTSDNHITKTTALAKIDTDRFAALKTENLNSLAGATISAAIKQTTLSK